MKKFVVSTSSNANFLLAEANLEEVVSSEGEALAFAEAATLETGDPHYVFEVDIKCIQGFRQTKSVEGFRVGRPE